MEHHKVHNDQFHAYIKSSIFSELSGGEAAKRRELWWHKWDILDGK
jgi:hypothetical protein